ncbi:protein-tyrosine phosphatase-like protein [Cokeromyces recurvatus]|uniref:protein-tyrosine phosphatase-like protein n=1 Tax=Cokeromyces recurvatus TaxID=90255 RepID=UPI00222038D9|nr:protein-tyrosine phosphatase-like protein [Cokeromyces recurvatus]KAI7899380.1 protein-tyrosine phosphatase-like protein [Cokeromyces recurvatus]
MNNNRLASLSPISSTSSTLASRRRRNNKNLSLCLSSETTNNMITETKHVFIEKQRKDDVNAYLSGPAKIMPYLYLGSEMNSLDLNLLKELRVQSILNVAAEVNNPYESMDHHINKENPFSFSNTLTYQKLPWQHNQDNLVVELAKAIDIIDRARAAEQTILVHCQCGVARSATVIIAYVMKTLHLPLQEAYNHVKALAPPISPNLGLLFQLREFEQTLLLANNDDSTHIKNIPKNGIPLLSHTSSFCTLKRELRSSTKSIFKSTIKQLDNNNSNTNSTTNDTNWWKNDNRRISLDNTATAAC